MIGIYQIRCDETQKSYIGQSTDVEKRWKQHISQLESNKHININFQADWNNYGKGRFSFAVLKECETEYLNLFEAYYIELFDSIRSGYNDSTVSRLSKKEYREYERISHINTIDIVFNLRTLLFVKSIESLYCVMVAPYLPNETNNELEKFCSDGILDELYKLFEYDEMKVSSFCDELNKLIDIATSVYSSIESLIKAEILEISGVEIEVEDPGWEFGKELEIMENGSFEIDITIQELTKTIVVNVIPEK